jgi:hypothetical protein
MSAGAFAWALALSVGRALWGRATRERGRLSERRATVITVGTLALALAALTLTLLPPS